jgi:DNA-binding HxlR family transcriptional regulator
LDEPRAPIDLTDEKNCPVRNIVDRIGDKWSLLILLVLMQADTVRFSELKRQIGNISQRMLAQTLRRLEQDGYVLRMVTPSSPIRVDYSLTELGLSLMIPVGGLIGWANDNFQTVLAARDCYVPLPPQNPL